MPVRSGPRLYGILVTYRRPEALADHLGRLRTQTRSIDHLVVVDNDASSRRADGGAVGAAIDRYRSGGRSADHLRMPANLGPAGAIAVGMESVIELGIDDDWVVLLDDDDPPFDHDVLDCLWSVAIATPDAVAAVGVIGSPFDRRSAHLRRLSDEELDGHAAVGHALDGDPLDGIIDVDYLGGNQLPLYRLAAIRAVGVFERDLFWGYDDLDFGLRLRRAGFRLVVSREVARRARAHHGRLGLDVAAAAPSSVMRLATWRRYYTMRNLVHLLRKQGLDRVAIRRAVAAGIAKPMVNAPRRPVESMAQLSAGVRGALDGWFDRLGRRVTPSEKPA